MPAANPPAIPLAFHIPLHRRDGTVAAHAIVDYADWLQYGHRRWTLTKNGYVQGRRYGQNVLLHRVILGLWPKDGLVADHINRNKLDCRRANLRACTQRENQQNRDPSGNRGSSSKYRGVCFHAPTKKWRVTGRVNGKTQYVGTYLTEEEAAAAARTWRAEHMPYAID